MKVTSALKFFRGVCNIYRRKYKSLRRERVIRYTYYSRDILIITKIYIRFCDSRVLLKNARRFVQDVSHKQIRRFV